MTPIGTLTVTKRYTPVSLAVPRHALDEWHALCAGLARTDPAAVPCRGTLRDDWDANTGPMARLAADRCHDCPLFLDCRRYAVLARERVGVWGGTTPKDRNRKEPTDD